jgi:hypothetical protein
MTWRRDYAALMESILLAASEGTKKGEMFRPSPLAASLLSQEVPPRPLPPIDRFLFSACSRPTARHTRHDTQR